MSQKISGVVRANCFAVMSRAVEEGVAYGWQRAHKHTDAPDEVLIRTQIEEAVLNAICEVFSFDE